MAYPFVEGLLSSLFPISVISTYTSFPPTFQPCGPTISVLVQGYINEANKVGMYKFAAATKTKANLPSPPGKALIYGRP